MNLEILEWFQKWLSQNCDGDWEHAQNIIITTIDNPGWGVTINLVGTKLESSSFNTIKKDNGEHDWYFCTVKDQQFQGDGGVNNLIDILQVFITWADKL